MKTPSGQSNFFTILVSFIWIYSSHMSFISAIKLMNKKEITGTLKTKMAFLFADINTFKFPNLLTEKHRISSISNGALDVLLFQYGFNFPVCPQAFNLTTILFYRSHQGCETPTLLPVYFSEEKKTLEAIIIQRTILRLKIKKMKTTRSAFIECPCCGWATSGPINRSH